MSVECRLVHNISLSLSLKSNTFLPIHSTYTLMKDNEMEMYLIFYAIYIFGSNLFSNKFTL